MSSFRFLDDGPIAAGFISALAAMYAQPFIPPQPPQSMQLPEDPPPQPPSTTMTQAEFAASNDLTHFPRGDGLRLPKGWRAAYGGAHVSAAERHNIDPKLVGAIINAESAFSNNPRLTSKAGAIGPMQLMPKTAKGLKVDPYDPAQNIDGGTRYIADMLRRYYNDLPTALMAYNWGPGNVDSWLKSNRTKKVPRETVDYVRKVLAGALDQGAPE